MAVKVGLKVIEIWNDSMEKAVCKYEEETVEKGQIVFYGPSNFTRWKTEKWGMRPLREDIKGASGAPCCVNRGFGSSCAEHQLYYYDRMIRPLAPRVLVYSSYGNSEAFGYSAEETWELAQRVVAYAMTDFPDIKIYLVGVNPSAKKLDTCQIGNRARYNSWLKSFAENTPNCYFIDPMSYEPLLADDIYVPDGHFNQKGYDLYGDFFREALKDELAKY